MQPRSIPSLTGIRGIAAVWVFSYHIAGYAGTMLASPGFFQSRFFQEGFRGVDLFFVLSGFILMHVHGAEFVNPGRAAVQNFFIIRFFRVYPLNTVILLGLVPLALYAPAYVAQSRAFTDPHFSYRINNFSAAGFFQTLFLVQTWTIAKLGEWNGPSWTLSAEVLGYLSFPLLAVFVMRQRLASLCILMAGLALLAMVAALIAGHHCTTNTNPSGSFGAVRMAGCFTAGALVQRAHFLLGDQSAKWAARLTILSVALLAATLFRLSVSILDCFIFAMLIFGLASQRGAIDWLLRTRIALWLGKISFSFYLLHEVLLSIFRWLILPIALTCPVPIRALILAGLIIICFMAGWAMFHLVERPSQRLGRSAVNRLQTTAAGGKRAVHGLTVP